MPASEPPKSSVGTILNQLRAVLLRQGMPKSGKWKSSLQLKNQDKNQVRTSALCEI